jgi:putative transposase
LLQDERRGWDHLGVLFWIVCRLVRCLFGLPAMLVRSDLPKDAELLVLRHENQVLRRQLSGRLRWDPAGRLWLAALSRLVGRRQWPEVFPVTPATLLRWHPDLAARKWDYTSRRRAGRPSTGTAVKALVVRMARENPAWGIGGSRGSWRGWGMRSRRPRCGRSCTPLASSLRPGGPGRPGGSSWPPRLT